MKKILSFSFLLWGSLSVFAQAGLHLPFLPDQFEATWTQPAWVVPADSMEKARVGGGGFLRVHTYPFAIQQLTGLPSFLDDQTKADLISSLGTDRNRLGFTQRYGGGVQAQVGPVSLGLGYRNVQQLFGQINDPATLELLLLGNAPFAGEMLSDQGVAAHSVQYHEASVNVGYKIGDIRVGIRPKLYIGQAYTGLIDANYTFFTEENGAYIDLAGGYEYFQTQEGTSPGIGFGLDLGATMDVTDKLLVQVSVLDLGGMRFKGQTRQNTFSVRYEGVDLGNVFTASLDSGISIGGPDSLVDQIWVTPQSGTGQYNLPFQGMLGASYQLSSADKVFASVHYGSSAADLDEWLVNVGYHRALGSWGLVGVNGFLGGPEQYGVGAMAALKVPFGPKMLGRIFISADNLLGVVAPASASGLIVQGGLTLALRKPAVGKKD